MRRPYSRAARVASQFNDDELERACNDPLFLAFCRACEEYRKRGGIPTKVAGPDPDFEYFDPDELGIDPEDDEEVWY